MLLIDPFNLVLDLVRGRLRQHRGSGANGKEKATTAETRTVLLEWK